MLQMAMCVVFTVGVVHGTELVRLECLIPYTGYTIYRVAHLW